MNNPTNFFPFTGDIIYDNGVAYVECGAGSIDFYFEGAKKLLKEIDDVHTIKFEFQSKTITINNNTTIEEVWETLHPKLSKEEKARIQKSRDELIKELRELSSRDFDTMMKSLSEVEKTDLVSGEAEASEVLGFSKQIARILANATNVVFTDETAKALAYQLIKLGCVSIDSINGKYLTPNKELNLLEHSLIQNKINLPAIIWTNILKANPVTTNHAIGNLGELLANWANDHIAQNEESPNQ